MAIAYDTSATSNTGSASSLTYSHTCTGASLILIVQVWCGDSRTISSITYNGVAMTNLATITGGSIPATERGAIYYLVAPTTGSNNIIVTLSGSTKIASNSVSYTGVAQALPIDASRTEVDLNTTSAYAEAITSIADNCWAVWATKEFTTSVTAGANTALRQRENTQYGIILADSNALITPAGSRTMNLNAGGGGGNFLSDILLTLTPSLTSSTSDTSTSTESYTFSYGRVASISETSTSTESLISSAPTQIWSKQSENSSTWSNQNKN